MTSIKHVLQTLNLRALNLRALNLRANPIVVKELRSRMRGARAFIILTGVLVLLAGVSYVFYRIVLAATRYSNSPIGPQIGYTLLVALMLVEMLIVCFITPAVTAGAISGEKEKLTYEMLFTTPLRPSSILWGKLLSALAYVFLLILASIPMASLVFVYGGITLADMVKAMAVLVATAITLGVVGTTVSAWLKPLAVNREAPAHFQHRATYPVDRLLIVHVVHNVTHPASQLLDIRLTEPARGHGRCTDAYTAGYKR